MNTVASSELKVNGQKNYYLTAISGTQNQESIDNIEQGFS